MVAGVDLPEQVEPWVIRIGEHLADLVYDEAFVRRPEKYEGFDGVIQPPIGGMRFDQCLSTAISTLWKRRMATSNLRSRQ